MTLAYPIDQHAEPYRPPSREAAGLARLGWEVAVDQLARPGQARVTRDDGTTETAEVLSLLDQLAEAVMPGQEHNGKIGGPKSRPPAALGVLALLAEIRQEMRRCCWCHDHAHPEDLAAQVRLWVEHADDWQHTEPDYVTWAATTAAEWVRQARLLLDPPPRYTLRGRTCPLCTADTVSVWSDDEGDYIRRPALSINPERIAAVCGACGHEWPLRVWVELATELGLPTDPAAVSFLPDYRQRWICGVDETGEPQKTVTEDTPQARGEGLTG
ncbi:DUF7341 domain-containing protein [Amycolatopsis anabasis]|uniref:DUF7341 domain-containing protein n=1 Tax=Amycolatopsis anabasis TaxID=1840409 RepID=UPI00131B6807|nr:hypothetical protein [Amycolatopsis anabasis]